jgi:protoporphyrinogen oxidase
MSNRPPLAHVREMQRARVNRAIRDMEQHEKGFADGSSVTLACVAECLSQMGMAEENVTTVLKVARQVMAMPECAVIHKKWLDKDEARAKAEADRLKVVAPQHVIPVEAHKEPA